MRWIFQILRNDVVDAEKLNDFTAYHAISFKEKQYVSVKYNLSDIVETSFLRQCYF